MGSRIWQLNNGVEITVTTPEAMPDDMRKRIDAAAGDLSKQVSLMTEEREKRLRMVAEAVSGLSRKDWSDAKEKIDRLFSYPANIAGNRVTIGKTPEEIMDILNQEF